MAEINLHPTTCNICGGEVVFTSNAEVYGGKTYGSGKCYLCKQCGAYVGTHKPRPDEAMGILADHDMRAMKRAAHELFDSRWSSPSERAKQYQWLADQLGIPPGMSHFGYFDKPMLRRAIELMLDDMGGEA